jgi:hypothetical protein
VKLLIIASSYTSRAMSPSRVVGPTFFEDSTNSTRYCQCIPGRASDILMRLWPVSATWQYSAHGEFLKGASARCVRRTTNLNGHLVIEVSRP